MKKKLTIGLGTVLLIFIVGSIVVVQNLQSILSNQQIINKQDAVIARYNQMLFQIKSSQAELYRHQAGYTRNIDDLVEFIEGFDTNLNVSLKAYSSDISNAVCLQCHEDVQERVSKFNAILTEARESLSTYKEDVSILITSRDSDQQMVYEELATENGIKLVSLVGDIQHIADIMRLQVKDKGAQLISRSLILIFLTLTVSFLLAVIVIFLLMKSITGPIESLVNAIEDIPSGKYSKVDVASKDEIGFLADTINQMTESLQKTNLEKDRLLSQLQEFNRNLEGRVKEATSELQTANENLLRSETLTAVGTLAAGVSHEVSTPLNSILGFTQFLLSEMDEADQMKGDMKAIEQEALRAKRIVQGLLNFARTSKHEAEVVDLNSILSEILTLLFYQPSMKSIVLKKDMERDLLKVEADPSELKQVFFNLIINAVQSMPEGGELHIKTENYAEGVMVTISDTGEGISEEKRRKIFQPFYTTKADGTGLGLSICYGIISSHGGDITIESTEGSGSTFRVYILAEEKEWQES